MVNDYVARKRRKKRSREELDADPAESDKRARKKRRPAVRRLCKGMCYLKPELTEEDKVEEIASDGKFAVRRQPATPPHELRTCLRIPKDEKLRESGLGKQSEDKQRLSTAINLILPTSPSIAKLTGDLQKGALEMHMKHFPNVMQQAMLDAGHTEPMPIQERCWPICLEGTDLSATAEPGSGKTLAYLLPLGPRLQPSLGSSGSASGPSALILVPTRELAQQVAAECRVLKNCSGMSTAMLIGGVDKSPQVDAIADKPNIVVATPGRLLEMATEGLINLEDVKVVVLDEADKMLSLGLQPQLDALHALLLPLRILPGPVIDPTYKRPQVLMFSATSTSESEAAAEKWLWQPEMVHLGITTANISRTIVQAVQVCAEHKKPQKLLKHLQQIKEQSGHRNPPRVLIFANRIKTVRFVCETVREAGLRVAMLHGERSQAERDEAMLAFRSGKAQVLVATDVAARGLHIRGLPYVVNYDFPSNLEQYIHRAGRTGRLAADGHCYSFFTRNLAALAQPLLGLLQDHGQAVDPNLVQLADAYQTALGALQVSGDEGSGREVLNNLSDSAVGVEDAALTEVPDSGVRSEAAKQADGPKISPVTQAAGKQQKRSLLGRLRKKLARQRGQHELA